MRGTPLVQVRLDEGFLQHVRFETELDKGDKEGEENISLGQGRGDESPRKEIDPSF